MQMRTGKSRNTHAAACVGLKTVDVDRAMHDIVTGNFVPFRFKMAF